MSSIGTLARLWRYPVKSMGGEELKEAFVGFAGIYGDRIYAVKNSASRKGFPYLNATSLHSMLTYQPQFRYPERMLAPTNYLEAMRISPGVSYANAEAADNLLDVGTPANLLLDIEDPALLQLLKESLSSDNHLSIVRSDRALTD